MPATVLVSPDERPVMQFVLARAEAFYQRGTTEQRESARSIQRMLQGLDSAPDGAVELDFLTQDAYLIGVRLFSTSVELEDYWLDARAGLEGVELPEPELELAAAVQRYLPDLAADPAAWRFDQVRGTFTDLGFRFDRAVTQAAPRARGMYNGDREEMTDKAVETSEQRAALREARRALEVAPSPGTAATAVQSRPVMYDWGVDAATGLRPDDIPADSFRALTLGSVNVLITNFGGQLSAISGSCSHQAQWLGKARRRGAAIVCPRHGAEFDLCTGKELCPPFCERWMEANGMKAQMLALLTPNKKGGDLQTFPLRLERGEIVLRV